MDSEIDSLSKELTMQFFIEVSSWRHRKCSNEFIEFNWTILEKKKNEGLSMFWCNNGGKKSTCVCTMLSTKDFLLKAFPLLFPSPLRRIKGKRPFSFARGQVATQKLCLDNSPGNGASCSIFVCFRGLGPIMTNELTNSNHSSYFPWSAFPLLLCHQSSFFFFFF